MLRPVLFAVAVVALVAPVQAADADLSGKWLLSSVGPAGESVLCIVKVETKDGKPAASVQFSPDGVETAVTDFRATGTAVNLSIRQTRILQNQKLTTETAFVGVRGKDPKVILGSTGDNRFRTRAKLTATDKPALAKDELIVRADVPEPMKTAQQLNAKATLAQNRWLTEKDAEKKKELQKEFAEVAREANEKVPGLYREVVEKHADSPTAFDAATTLLRMAARTKPTAAEAEKLVALARKHAEPYGPLFAGVALGQVADALAAQPDMAPVAVAAIEPSAKALTDDDPATFQSAVLGTYRNALQKAGKADQAKEISTRIDKLEPRIDAEYLKTVPPFKPTSFAGRKDKSANQVVLMELFTGAQCPPCVAADVAFDALLKTYKPTDLVMVQYHTHIPGPDPMTNPDTLARWDYYRKLFPYNPEARTGIGGVPSTLFNGKPQAGGGGGMSNAEPKYRQYVSVIDPLLEKSTPVKLAGKATRNADKIDIAVEVLGGDEMKLRLLVVEENVKYVGSNQIRFHHQVVRAMPGGPDGVAVTDKTFKHTAAVDLADVRKGLTKYLNEFVAANPNRPFARARPADGHEGRARRRLRPERQDRGNPASRPDRGRWQGRRRRTVTID